MSAGRKILRNHLHHDVFTFCVRVSLARLLMMMKIRHKGEHREWNVYCSIPMFYFPCVHSLWWDYHTLGPEYCLHKKLTWNEAISKMQPKIHLSQTWSRFKDQLPDKSDKRFPAIAPSGTVLITNRNNCCGRETFKFMSSINWHVSKHFRRQRNFRS